MSKNHSFNPDVAVIFGVTAAIIVHHIWFWTLKNIEKKANYYDGAYWTYDSVRTLAERFPYLTHKQIRDAIDMLVAQNVIKKGNYNRHQYDRTSWYALTDEGISIVQKCYMDLSPEANGSAPSGEPIPDVSTDVTADTTTDTMYAAILSHLNKKVGTAYTLTANTKKLIDARLADGIKAEDFAIVVDYMVLQWKDNAKMAQYLRPQTLFGDNMRRYLEEAKAAATNRLSDLDDVF